MKGLPNLDDLNVFVHVARLSSFIATAGELGVSAGYVSKRIKALEVQLQSSLFHRTTRLVTLTNEGERVLTWAIALLQSVGKMADDLNSAKRDASGHLRVATSLGLGRKIVGPALRAMSDAYPGLDIRLDIHDRLVNLADEGYDLDIRVGNDISPHLIAKPLAKNLRILCASPGYLDKKGAPTSLEDLMHHNCLILKERDHPYGVWELEGPNGKVSMKISGTLATNHGEIARDWCLEGKGILLRSTWDVSRELADRELIRVLPTYSQSAHVWAVHTVPMASCERLRAAITFLIEHFESACPTTLTKPGDCKIIENT